MVGQARCGGAALVDPGQVVPAARRQGGAPLAVAGVAVPVERIGIDVARAVVANRQIGGGLIGCGQRFVTRLAADLASIEQRVRLQCLADKGLDLEV